MRAIKQSGRARGGNRGGCGGGSEPTDPDYASKKLRKLRADYEKLDPEWRKTFLDGLSRFERKFVVGDIRS